MNTTDQARWLYLEDEATNRPNKRQRRASSEGPTDWSQQATSDNHVSTGYTAEDGDAGNCSEGLDDMVEGMLTGFAEKLRFASWKSAEDSTAPSLDEWPHRLIMMDASLLGEYPHGESCWTLSPHKNVPPYSSTCSVLYSVSGEFHCWGFQSL